MRYIIGPEILWGALYGAVFLLARKNVAPAYPLDKVLGNLYLYVPLAAVLTFLLWYAPGVEKRWLLLRVWTVCLVIGHFILEKGLSAHSQQGPGTGMSYLVGMLLLLLALAVGGVWVKVRF